MKDIFILQLMRVISSMLHNLLWAIMIGQGVRSACLARQGAVTLSGQKLVLSPWCGRSCILNIYKH